MKCYKIVFKFFIISCILKQIIWCVDFDFGMVGYVIFIKWLLSLFNKYICRKKVKINLFMKFGFINFSGFL